MKQVVVIEDEYGLNIYADKEVEVIQFEFRQYADEIPDKFALDMLRREIDKVTQPDARAWLETWYAENKQWSTDLDESIKVNAEETKRRRIAEAISILEEYGEM